MKVFAQIVRTVVNTVALPVAVVKDVATLGNIGGSRSYTVKAVEKLKEEAEED